MFEFLTQWDVGLNRVIDFMNGWAAEFPRLEDLLVVRYEDLRARPEETLAGLLAFLGMPGSKEEVAEAVSFADFENMKKMEQKRTFWLSGGRMVPRDRGNPSSFKVRRGKVAGYRDYFDAAENEEIDAIIRDRLSPEFGYALDEPAPARPATA